MSLFVFCCPAAETTTLFSVRLVVVDAVLVAYRLDLCVLCVKEGMEGGISQSEYHELLSRVSHVRTRFRRVALFHAYLSPRTVWDVGHVNLRICEQLARLLFSLA